MARHARSVGRPRLRSRLVLVAVTGGVIACAAALVVGTSQRWYVSGLGLILLAVALLMSRPVLRQRMWSSTWVGIAVLLVAAGALLWTWAGIERFRSGDAAAGRYLVGVAMTAFFGLLAGPALVVAGVRDASRSARHGAGLEVSPADQRTGAD